MNRPRPFRWLPLFSLALLACAVFAPRPAPPVTPTAALTVTASPTLTPTLIPTSTPPPICAYHLQPESIQIHPEPQLYSGDQVSLEVIADTPCAAWQNARVVVRQESLSATLGAAPIAPYGLGGRQQATLPWVWDATGLQGEQTLIITVHPADQTNSLGLLDTYTLTVNLLPADQRPLAEQQAHWARATSACCIFNYLTGTAAERDLESIKARADAAAAQVKTRLGVQRPEQIEFTLLDRLLGHGGFAANGIAFTYIDRNPVGNNLDLIFRHELTHILEAPLTSRRPIILAEGLAVYVAGGHFKEENLDQRAAALVALGRYIPLKN